MPKLQGAIFDVDGRLIQAADFTAYPDALRFVIATKDAGMLIADASSSKNAALFLRQIRLDDAQHVALAGIFEEPHEP
jgi:hypothetical protein